MKFELGFLMFFVPEKSEFDCDLHIEEWSWVLQSRFCTQTITRWFILRCWHRQMLLCSLSYNSHRASDERTCSIEGEGDVWGGWEHSHLPNNFLLFTEGSILSVLPSTKFSVCPSLKFPFHCGVLLRRLRVKLRPASSWASLLPTALPRTSGIPLGATVPFLTSIPCMPCRSQSNVANLASPWDFSASSVESGQWKDQWSICEQVSSSYHGAVHRILW